MISTTKSLALRALATLAASGLLLVGAADVSAQEEEQEPAGEECVLEPSGPVNTAAEALEMARTQEGSPEAATHYREALTALEEPLAEGTDDPAAYVLAAQAHIGIGEYEEADQHLDRFEELAPECGEAARNTRYNAWATAYNDGIQAYQSGDEETALQNFQAANLIHDDPRSYNNAALLYHQRGETERAVELWREAMQANGDEEQVRSAVDNLAEVYRAEERPEEAVEVYETYLEEHPDDVVIRIRYASALRDVGRTDEATQIFQEIMGREDLTEGQWNQVGIGLFDAENYEEAREAFQKGREVNPFAKDLMENLISASIQADQPGTVSSLADTLVSWYPYDNSSHQLKAHVLSRMGQGQQAMQALQAGEDTPVVFQEIQMARTGENTWTVRGVLAAREQGGGQQMTIPFEFLGEGGEVVQTEEVTVQAPPAGQSTTVELQVSSQQPIAGFRYGADGGAGGSG